MTFQLVKSIPPCQYVFGGRFRPAQDTDNILRKLLGFTEARRVRPGGTGGGNVFFQDIELEILEEMGYPQGAEAAEVAAAEVTLRNWTQSPTAIAIAGISDVAPRFVASLLAAELTNLPVVLFTGPTGDMILPPGLADTCVLVLRDDEPALQGTVFETTMPADPTYTIETIFRAAARAGFVKGFADNSTVRRSALLTGMGMLKQPSPYYPNTSESSRYFNDGLLRTPRQVLQRVTLTGRVDVAELLPGATTLNVFGDMSGCFSSTLTSTTPTTNPNVMRPAASASKELSYDVVLLIAITAAAICLVSILGYVLYSRKAGHSAEKITTVLAAPSAALAATRQTPSFLPGCHEQRTATACYVVELLQTEVQQHLALVDRITSTSDQVQPPTYYQSKFGGQLYFKVSLPWLDLSVSGSDFGLDTICNRWAPAYARLSKSKTMRTLASKASSILSWQPA